MIKRITAKIRTSNNGGLFHDSRHDIKALSTICNHLIDKVNELTDEVNELESKKD